MLPTGIAGFGDPLPACAPAPRYERHRPEQTLLYQIVDKHYPDFLAQLAAEDRFLPDYVQQDFTEFLKCGLLEHGFFESALRKLSPREAGGILLQTKRVLPQLRSPAHGRERSFASR